MPNTANMPQVPNRMMALGSGAALSMGAPVAPTGPVFPVVPMISATK